MEHWQLLLIVGTLIMTMSAFGLVVHKLSVVGRSGGFEPRTNASDAVNLAVNQAFSEDFREELRQRARQQFEQLIHENAMFLQQDVRISATQLEDFMKNEVVSTLQQELSKHHEAIAQTRQMLSDSVTKSQADLQNQIDIEKERRIQQLDGQIAEIVKKYVTTAIGDILTTDQQVALVIDGLNAKKADIIEDIRRV